MKTPQELRPNQQTCKRCGAVDKFNFHVPDWLWNWVANTWSNNVLCLACFDDLATKTNTDWIKEVTHVCFAGDQGCGDLKFVDPIDRKEFRS